MNIRIDTDVPLPNGGYTKYPFDSLKVGHSFAVPKAAVPHLMSYVHVVSKRMKRKFVCRTVKEGKTEMLRVWRAA